MSELRQAEELAAALKLLHELQAFDADPTGSSMHLEWMPGRHSPGYVAMTEGIAAAISRDFRQHRDAVIAQAMARVEFARNNLLRRLADAGLRPEMFGAKADAIPAFEIVSAERDD